MEEHGHPVYCRSRPGCYSRGSVNIESLKYYNLIYFPYILVFLHMYIYHAQLKLATLMCYFFLGQSLSILACGVGTMRRKNRNGYLFSCLHSHAAQSKDLFIHILTLTLVTTFLVFERPQFTLVYQLQTLISTLTLSFESNRPHSLNIPSDSGVRQMAMTRLPNQANLPNQGYPDRASCSVGIYRKRVYSKVQCQAWEQD